MGDLLLLLCMAFALYVVVDSIVEGRPLRLTRDDGLDEVRRRDRAMAALATMSDTRTHRVSQWNECVSCGGNVLVENTYNGTCSDCLYDSGVYLPTEEDWDRIEHDWQTAQMDAENEAEWHALQRAIEDEQIEGEDHR